MTTEEKKARAATIRKELYALYPNPTSSLHYTTPFELLIATMLSAQTTDKLVNQITPSLFAHYPTVYAFSTARLADIDTYIKKVNFHTNKANNILATSKLLVKTYQGEVPNSMENLLTLPGVARKTANVVLGTAFHKTEGIVVDTHVMRLSQKFGLTEEKTPEKIERDLMNLLPKKYWIDFSHLMIAFGRQYCTARMHECRTHPLGDMLHASRFYTVVEHA